MEGLPAFSPRDDILDPTAVVGLGDVAVRLAQRLLRYEPEQIHALRGLAGEDFLLALGPTELLPWVDGVAFLGRDPAAPLLLIPTQVRPNIAMDIFERAVVRHAERTPGPYAVIDRPRRIISLVNIQPMDRDLLDAWVKEHP